ncbi:hypothetical protein [Burkholderia sp. PAMC 26561]|uniref:hypothetical protein n=1 Tax=Burkholderia sp. PAMC 26561 TaxID=1795043 RepID=UPI001F1CCFF0|nr:hypothetical protein [Burkholderia sp. PAMC 26561]
MSGHGDEAAFQAAFPGKKLRYFFAPDEVFFFGGATYALSRAWAGRTLEAAELLRGLLRNSNEVSWEPASSTNEEETYDGYVLKRMANGPIELEQDGHPVTPVMPVLRILAQKLRISTLYEGGTEANTQQLGKRVIAAIQSL